MSDAAVLHSVSNVLAGCVTDGIDPEGVQALLDLIANPTEIPPTPTGRSFTRSECAEPDCPWVNSHLCPFAGEHRWELRTYALVPE